MSLKKRGFIYLLENRETGVLICKFDKNFKVSKCLWCLFLHGLNKNCAYISDIIRNRDAKIKGLAGFEFLDDGYIMNKDYCWRLTRQQFDRISKMERLAGELSNLMDEYCPNVFYKETK